MHLSWTIIHFVFLIPWLVFFFVGARLVRKQYGTWQYVLMLAGLLGMMITRGQSYSRKDFSQMSLISEQSVLEDFSAFNLAMKTHFDRD